MSKISPAMSPARRNAEALLNQSMKREASFKWEQEREYEAMVSKTAHLRELRLAKEAAESCCIETHRSSPHIRFHGDLSGKGLARMDRRRI